MFTVLVYFSANDIIKLETVTTPQNSIHTTDADETRPDSLVAGVK